MKIEMGESLVASWLKHICGCVIVQTNWKPSPRWQEHNYDEIERLVQDARAYFNARNLNVFKQNDNAAQILHQTECDVVGLNKTANSAIWHVAEVAFHENGVQYGDKYVTAAKIAGKMFRAAIGIYCYMDTREGVISFATPKVTQSYVAQIVPAFEAVEAFFREKGFDFSFNLLVNERFRNDILMAVSSLVDEVSDTSELFLRSIQLRAMFTTELIAGLDATAHTERCQALRCTDEREVKVGRLVNSVMREILEGLSDDTEVMDLLDANYSKQAFGINYPLLVRVGEQNINNARYYSTPLTICGNQYRLCNDWYPRNRGSLEAWISSHEPHDD